MRILCLFLMLFMFSAYDYGYYTEDATGDVVGTICIVSGAAPVKEGATFVPCSKEAMLTKSIREPAQTDEQKIKSKIRATDRTAAIEALKASGDLPQNYKDQ